MGPHTFNFAEAAVMAEAAGAAFRVPDMAAGLACGLGLLQDPEALPAARAGAETFAASQGGAATRTVQALKALPRLT
jgi:3-deoxy-D-manno-octulosonic-acid transferase